MMIALHEIIIFSNVTVDLAEKMKFRKKVNNDKLKRAFNGK
jgi:hypothetical protein